MDQKILTAYGPKIPTKKTSLHMKKGEGRTKQSNKDECNINLILKKHGVGAMLTQDQYRSLTFTDTTGMDFTVAMQTVAHANSMFEQLPSEIRKDFQNDPAVFLDAYNNEDYQEYFVEKGMKPVLETSTPPPATPVVDPILPEGETKTPPTIPADTPTPGSEDS